jgi:hypothetical protein
MPGRKRPAKAKKSLQSSDAPWQVILEEIRSQNVATMEAVEARHEEMRREVQNFRGEMHTDVSVLRTVVQGLAVDVRDLKAGLGRVESKVDKLLPLEERVTKLERRGA